MDPERQRRLKKLVLEARELPGYQRDNFLLQNCDDPEQLEEARVMLSHALSDGLDENENVLLSADIPDLTGSKIGPYQILELLGEGGMGQVYLADQSAPLRRKVALKVIKIGMDTREVITRFESERQALALMDHPNIAKVFDAGATGEGRPFFVMEYIPGISINQYCQENGLGLRQRLDLFIQVCQGVQHAHQKGVIHRDLKPGNILVTEVEGKPVPKIIDFGVAKAMASHLTAMTMFTRIGQLIGTPEYMSPEQADSSLADVDTRSDVYSLGVLLYELLTGRLPLERREILQAGFKRMALMVQNEIPQKPSTRIDTEAKQARRDIRKIPAADTCLWAKRVRGDLDWITMKALEKDRDRRYGSAADLAVDLTRHLDHKAVSAGPPSGMYRMGKFMRRNRAGVALAVSLLMALVGFAIWQTHQSRTIVRERDKALANERLSLAREQLTKDPTMAVAFALSSLEILDQPSAREVVRQALAKGPIRHEMPRWGQNGNPITVDASADGRFCVVPWSQTENPTIGIYNLADYSMRVFQAPSSGIVYEARFNADGSFVTASGPEGIHVWRVADGEHVLHLTSTVDFRDYFIFRLADPNKMAVWVSNPGVHTLWLELNILEGSIRELGRSLGVGGNLSSTGSAIDQAATRILDIDGPRFYLQRVEDLDTDRATLVGQHEQNLSSVAFDPTCSTAASVDFGGHIKVWDLTTSPPSLVREFQEEARPWYLEFDPYGNRFYSSWGSGTVNVYDLSPYPKRKPLALQDRSFWAHMGSFLSDGSLLTSRNGLSHPVAHWKSRYPVAWSLDLSGLPGGAPQADLSRDGRVLFLNTIVGEVIGVPLVSGVTKGVGSLGWTRPWGDGLASGFYADLDRGRCLSYCFGPPQVLDFNSGEARDLTELAGTHWPAGLSPSGRFAYFLEYTAQDTFTVYDLDSLKVASILHLGGKDFETMAFTSDNALLVLYSDHIARFDLDRPAAQPDTLWRGDATGGGALLDHGRFALVHDGEMILAWVDLTDGKVVELGEMTGRNFTSADYHPGLGLVAVGGWWNSIEVFDVENGGRWSLPLQGEEKSSTNLWIDPLGRWLISKHEHQIMAWSLPLDPLFGDPEYGKLLASLRSLTNVRVAPDQTQTSGFRVTNALELEQE